MEEAIRWAAEVWERLSVGALLLVFVVGIWRGWWVLGSAHAVQMKDKDAQIAYQQARADRMEAMVFDLLALGEGAVREAEKRQRGRKR